jgi:hypothetical protein
MPQHGQYDPENAENTSSLFVFQEVPLRSEKLNLWNGNIQTAFETVFHVCSQLFSQGQSAVISGGSESSLHVVATDPASMKVEVQAGWAILADSFAGLKTARVVPDIDDFTAPQNQPRIDRIVLFASGALAIVEGIEAASPQSPAVPAGALSLAEIVLRPGMSQINNDDDTVNGYIQDTRTRFLAGDSHAHGGDRVPSESPDGVRTYFSTQQAFQAETLDVYVNGVLQERGIDFLEEEDGLGYTFMNPPAATYRIQHRYRVRYASDNEEY